MRESTDILYVITKANWGGAQRYVFDLATAMQSAGRSVAVAYGTPGLLAERLHSASIPTILIPGLGRDIDPRGDWQAYRALVSLFRDRRPRIVHLNSSKAGFVGALAAKRAGVPKIVFTAHGWAFTEPRSAPSKLAFEWLQRLTVRLATETIAVSEFVRDRVRSWGGLHENIRVIPLGICETDVLSRDEARSALAASDSSLRGRMHGFWVGTIAELHPNKGIDVGIEAWKAARDNGAEWLIIGDGQERRRLEALCREDASVHFLGFMPDASRYLRAFDLFLLPSRTEAFGYVILEAGISGVPVISSDAGGTREAGGPAMAVFASGDAAHLRAKLDACMRDADGLARTGKAMQAHIRASFTLGRMVAETAAVYDA